VRLFLDSSAIVKLYVPEPGSAQVKARCEEADEIIVSVLVLPETLATLSRLRRAGKLRRSEYAAFKRNLVAALELATVVELSPAVMANAIACVEKLPVRTLDALHVGAAMERSPDLFLTGDQRQFEAARGMALNAELVG